MNHILITLALLAPLDNDAAHPSWTYSCWDAFDNQEDWLPAWEAQVCGFPHDDGIWSDKMGTGKFIAPVWTPPAKLAGSPGTAGGSPATAQHSTLPDWSRERDVPRDVSRVD